MKLETYTYNKFNEFEEVFLNKLSTPSFESLLVYKTKLKKLISASTSKIFNNGTTKNLDNELLEYAIKEINAEKIYYGQEIQNSLEQVLSSLNFYLDALIIKDENDDSKHFKELKKLTNDALFVSKEIANDLMYNQLSNKSLVLSLQELIDNTSFNKSIKINLTTSNNFNESKLSITKKHQIYNSLKIALRQILLENKTGNINIKMAYFYGTLIKIEIHQKRALFKKINFDKKTLHGYNNLKHRLAILDFDLQQKSDKDLKIILKTRLISKLNSLYVGKNE